METFHPSPNLNPNPNQVRKKNRMDFLNEGSRARQQVHAALLSNPTPTPLLTLNLPLLTLTLTLTHPTPPPY